MQIEKKTDEIDAGVQEEVTIESLSAILKKIGVNFFSCSVSWKYALLFS